jgi:hypothetical protein
MRNRFTETASRWRRVPLLFALIASAASAQTDQSGAKNPQVPETTPAKPAEPARGAPLPAFAVLGPSREIKLAENTWFRFGAQVQAWFRDAQDRIRQIDGSDGGYAYDFYCRRCRFFTTGSVVKDIYFNILFESSNLGKADPLTGAKVFTLPSILDAYGQIKFADAFWLSGGSILLPLTRNGTQPTTTYLSIDNANVDTSPILQGNTNVIRDLGFQANGFFLANHLEYRLGVFQGSRAPARIVGTLNPNGTCTPTATTTCTVTQSAGHNPPRFVGYLLANFWDPEIGYVNGGHYFGAKRVLGVMLNADYQILRNQDPVALSGTAASGVGLSKNPYYGISGAVFMNLPLSATPTPRGGDEFVALLQFGYYDGGARLAPAANPGTYPNVLKQTNYLAEAAYYNHGGHFSIFGKFEMRKISDDFPAALQATQNQLWAAGGVKYYVAPFNLYNFALQYERNNFFDSDKIPNQQSGTNAVTFQMQLILY